MTVFFIIYGLALVLCVFAFIRIQLASIWSHNALNAIEKYNQSRMDNNTWEWSDLKHYDLFRIDYSDLVPMFWIWGKYSAIKPEYQEMLKPYFD